MSFVADILKAAHARAADPCLVDVQGGKLGIVTGTQFLDAVSRARAFLRKHGVARGDRVALLASNSSQWAAVDVAIIAEGAICVPLYARQAPAQLAGMLRDAGPKVLIASDDALKKSIADAWPEACALATYADVFGNEPIAESTSCDVHDGPVTIVYTSGTSGEPKGAVLTGPNVDFMLDVTVQRIREMSVGARSEDRVFHYLPFCFAGSRLMLWSQLRRGNPLMMSTNLDNLQEELRAAAPHYFMNVPVLLERIKNGVDTKVKALARPVRSLYERATAAQRASLTRPLGSTERMALMLAKRMLFPRIKRMIGENLEFLVCGSARLSEDTQRWFQMIGIPVFQVYGLTETTGIVTIDDTSNVQPGRVGHVVPTCELRVTEDGELACRGPNVFAGYWNRPEATAQMIRDGWLHTGDQAELDESGSVKIVGRLKDVIVPESGHNVSPAAIEERLLQAGAGFEQAVVIGHGRPFLTAIVTGNVSRENADAALARVNAELPHYQRLRKLHVAHEAFSAENGLLTANQKLRRAQIEKHHTSAIEEMYR